MLLVAVAVAAALGFVGWLVLIYPKDAASGSGREVRITVTPGMDVGDLSRELAAGGAIEEPRWFAIYLRLLGADQKLRDGEVRLTDDMTPRDVLQRVARGFGSAVVRVTIPEGFHRFQIAARLESWEVCSEEDFLRAVSDRALLDELGIEAASAEGYLFPDTYRFPQDLDAEDVVRRMVANWHRRVDPIFEADPASLAWLEEQLSWGRAEVLTLASIIEKEAVVTEERPIIARVFINRMRSEEFRPKRLQADPTVSYGCLLAPGAAPSCASFDGRHITTSMLEDRANRYNTYRHEGLPPGPICNPGLQSIRAALSADAHDYLYFVARGHGRHAFSATLAEHNEAVARYRSGGQ